MSIYTKSIDNLISADLQELLDEQAVENGAPGVIAGKFTVMALDNLHSPYRLSDLSLSTALAYPLWERAR
jgi:hypothetical protein